MIRRTIAAVGVVGVILGVAIIVEPDLARGIGIESGWLLAVAALLLLQGYRVVRGRRRTEVKMADTPDPETEQDLEVPGQDFDRNLERAERGVANFQGRKDPALQASRRVEDRLREAAIATVSRKWGCSREQAREAVNDGTWTDDPYAAAFFTGSLEGVPLTKRLRLAVSAEPRFERRAARAAEAIADLSAAEEVDRAAIDERLAGPTESRSTEQRSDSSGTDADAADGETPADAAGQAPAEESVAGDDPDGSTGESVEGTGDADGAAQADLAEGVTDG